MFKKLCVVSLSLCIATAMIWGINVSCPNGTEQNTVTLCDMEAEEVLL